VRPIRRSRDAAPLVLVGGAVAQQPGRGGHAAVFLSWLLGLRDLGCRVALVDRLLPDSSPDDTATQLAWLRTVLEPHGLPVLLAGHDRVPRADLLLDVMGYADVEADRRVFVDVDPGFGQLWAELGLHDPYDGYDDLVTVGTAVGSPGSLVPTRGRSWLPVLPPVHLPSWPVAAGGPAFTTVASWRGPYGPVEHDGRSYGLRVHSFRQLLGARAAAGVDVELALDLDPTDAADRASLLAAGYRLADPAVVAATPDDYRRYVQHSLGELCVAKHLYVETAGGWFSDRSACYLASGRPVVAQDTGWTAALPSGEGLLAFTDTASAAAALAEVAAAPERHARAARALAEEHLASDVVLPGLLDRLGARPAVSGTARAAMSTA
jgi:hypothetical protein